MVDQDMVVFDIISGSQVIERYHEIYSVILILHDTYTYSTFSTKSLYIDVIIMLLIQIKLKLHKLNILHYVLDNLTNKLF